MNRGTTVALIASVVLFGCSKQSTEPPPNRESPDPAQASVEITSASFDDPATEPQDVVKAEVAVGGISGSYAAYFDDRQLRRIAEVRKPPGAATARGEYEFYGARLTHYQGIGLKSAGRIELRFDTQGGLTAASGSAGKISAEEVAAIRDRAQLLRSVALARRSVQAHGG